jgi:hypothetical protein
MLLGKIWGLKVAAVRENDYARVKVQQDGRERDSAA